MWHFLRLQGLYFLVGFVVAFVIYLFWRENVDFVLWGVGISSVAGLALSIGLFFLERRFERKEAPPARTETLPD